MIKIIFVCIFNNSHLILNINFFNFLYREAYKYGLINNFGGIVKIEILITKNNNKKYFFDSYFGLNFNYITIPTHIKENYEIKPISMVQLDETISLKSNLKLNNIPIDALSRISEMMNLNGKAIARQNYNMKELERYY